MSTATAEKLMTVDEFLALPDDGVERWLIRGQLRENGDSDMTMRSQPHSITEARTTGLLFIWLRTQPEPKGEIVCGEAGFWLRRDPDTVSAGVDVAVITAEQANSKSKETTFSVGVPRLIAEVLSPSDSNGDVAERVAEYLDCGVPVVWVLDPLAKTIVVHRPDENTIALDTRATLTGDPELPGFSAPVADFFR